MVIIAQRLVHEALGISKLLHYQDTTTFDVRTENRIVISFPMFYNRFSGIVFYTIVFKLYSVFSLSVNGL